MTFQLDERLARDTIVLSETSQRMILLMNNAAVPWFILVPKTELIEWHDLPEAMAQSINQEVRQLSRWVKSEFKVDKMNIASIGNVVAQLHIHVLGRYQADYCWPGVVWGAAIPQQYDEAEIENIKRNLKLSF